MARSTNELKEILLEYGDNSYRTNEDVKYMHREYALDEVKKLDKKHGKILRIPGNYITNWTDTEWKQWEKESKKRYDKKYGI